MPGDRTLASNNIYPRLSRHVQKEPARRSSSASPEARLSPGRLDFMVKLAVGAAAVEGSNWLQFNT